MNKHKSILTRHKSIKFSELIRTARMFGMDQNQMALLANISMSTFKRRSLSTILSFQIAERVLLLQNLYEIGLEVFDSSKDSFRDWLNREIPALQHHTPNDLLTSLLGIEIVKEELLKIEHGVY